MAPLVRRLVQGFSLFLSLRIADCEAESERQFFQNCRVRLPYQQSGPGICRGRREAKVGV